MEKQHLELIILVQRLILSSIPSSKTNARSDDIFVNPISREFTYFITNCFTQRAN